MRVSLWASAGAGLVAFGRGAWIAFLDSALLGGAQDPRDTLIGSLGIAAGLLWAIPHVALAWWSNSAWYDAVQQRVGLVSVIWAAVTMWIPLWCMIDGAMDRTFVLAPLAGSAMVLVIGGLLVATTTP